MRWNDVSGFETGEWKRILNTSWTGVCPPGGRHDLHQDGPRPRWRTLCRSLQTSEGVSFLLWPAGIARRPEKWCLSVYSEAQNGFRPEENACVIRSSPH